MEEEEVEKAHNRWSWRWHSSQKRKEERPNELNRIKEKRSFCALRALFSLLCVCVCPVLGLKELSCLWIIE